MPFMIDLNHLKQAIIKPADKTRKKAAVIAIIPQSLIPFAIVVTSSMSFYKVFGTHYYNYCKYTIKWRIYTPFKAKL